MRTLTRGRSVVRDYSGSSVAGRAGGNREGDGSSRIDLRTLERELSGDRTYGVRRCRIYARARCRQTELLELCPRFCELSADQIRHLYGGRAGADSERDRRRKDQLRPRGWLG